MEKGKKEYVTIERNNIKEILADIDMTQQELADTVGITRHHISKIANNRSKNITVAIAMKIAKCLGKKVEDVFEL